MSPLEYSLKLVHTIVNMVTNIRKNLLITTQKFLLLVYGGYYNLFWSIGTIFR